VHDFSVFAVLPMQMYLTPAKVSPPKVIHGAFPAVESFVSLFQGVQVGFIGQSDLKFKFLSCRKIEKFGKSHLSARCKSCQTKVTMEKYFTSCN